MVPEPKINISQGSLATIRRGGKHLNNCYIANYFNILCAKYYGNRSTFVETTLKQKGVHFWSTVYNNSDV